MLTIIKAMHKKEIGEWFQKEQVLLINQYYERLIYWMSDHENNIQTDEFILDFDWVIHTKWYDIFAYFVQGSSSRRTLSCYIPRETSITDKSVLRALNSSTKEKIIVTIRCAASQESTGFSANPDVNIIM